MPQCPAKTFYKWPSYQQTSVVPHLPSCFLRGCFDFVVVIRLNIVWSIQVCLLQPITYSLDDKLSICFRTLLLFEHSDTVILAGATALFTNNGTPSKVKIFFMGQHFILFLFVFFQLRGAVFFLLSVVGILLFDHDDLHDHSKQNHILFTDY